MKARQTGPWLGLAAVTFAGALVFWLFDALPFQDLPAHGGLIALRRRLPGSPFEQHFFVLAPHLGPYSLFRFLGDVLVVPLGPIRAIRAIATLPVVATPLALSWARRRLHGDRSPAVGYYGVALGFGFMTILGFASYLLGIAALIVGLTLWLELMGEADRGPDIRGAVSPWSRWRLEAGVTCAAPCIFLAHGHAFVIFLGLAGITTLVGGSRIPRLLRLRSLAPSLALAGWVAWRERASSVPAGSVPVPHAALVPHFQGIWDKLSLLVTPTLLTRTGPDVAVGIFIWTVVSMAAAATARTLGSPAAPGAPDEASRSHARALLVCTAGLAVVFLALPHSIGWFGFVDGRLVPLLLLVALMAVRRPALGPRLTVVFDRGAPVAAVSMVAIAMTVSYLFQAEAAGWREVLADVPADARLLNLPLEPDSTFFTGHPFVHYDKLILADRPVLVSDVWFHQGTGIYPTRDNPALRLPDSYSESDLQRIDWPAYRLDDWDYALIRMRPGHPPPAVPAPLTLTEHRGGWWLFRIDRN